MSLDKVYRLELFKPDAASQEAFVALNTFANQRRAEAFPDDPPRPLESTIKMMQGLKHFEQMEQRIWHVWHDQQIVAQLFTSVAFHESNQHLMNIDLGVLPAYRKQGIARGLLQQVLKEAQSHERNLIMDVTNSNIPAGAAFAKHIGATVGLETHTNQLHFADLDTHLLQAWLRLGETTATDFELGFWPMPLPAAELDQIASMMQVMNNQPRDELKVEDSQISAKDIRDHEAFMTARGVEHWMIFARHRSSQELAGYTEISLEPDDPGKALQGDTGVLPAYRGHGLGKWLKASMIHKLQTERPQVRRILTGNADSNAAMLAINHKLGFKPYVAHTVWQLERHSLEAYLNSGKV